MALMINIDADIRRNFSDREGGGVIELTNKDGKKWMELEWIIISYLYLFLESSKNILSPDVDVILFLNTSY